MMRLRRAPHGRALRSLAVIAVLAAGAATLVACQPGSPVGAIDRLLGLQTDRQRVQVSGWAYDPDAGDTPLRIVVTLDGNGIGQTTTGGARPDVAARLGAGASSSGFSLDVAVDWQQRQHLACVWVDNVGPGERVLLGCRKLGLEGHLDVFRSDGERVVVRGWFFDSYEATSPVRVFVGDPLQGPGPIVVDPALPRPDLVAAHPEWAGTAAETSGFELELPGYGLHHVCISVATASLWNGSLGCRDVGVQYPGYRIPTSCCFVEGTMLSAEAVPGGVHVTGWVRGGSRLGTPPVPGGTTPFFVDGGAVTWDAANLYWTRPLVQPSSLLAAGVDQVAGSGFDTVLATDRHPASVCMGYPGFGGWPATGLPTLSCVPVDPA